MMSAVSLRAASRALSATDEARLFRAPGRVNLIGEHTDYNDGFVLPMVIDRDVVVAATPRVDRRVRVQSLDMAETVEFDLDYPSPVRRGLWLDYVEGVAQTFQNLWGIDVASWALTIMIGEGEAILPQEPYRSWNEYLLPARPMVLWHYTDLSDPRWTIGKKYLRLRADAAMREPQKIGIANQQRWAAYYRQRTLFIKRFEYEAGANYPDYGSNNEVYTSGSFIEVESLGPLRHLEPNTFAEHVERWYLFDNIRIDGDEARLDEVMERVLRDAPEV